MAGPHVMLLAIVLSLSARALAETETSEVSSLQGLYKSLNSPPQLTGWEGGDPCGESWKGISCSGRSVTTIKIQGLGIRGSLGTEFSALSSLKELDVSDNNIGGEIPYSLPANATFINLSSNNFSMNIPYSLPPLKRLVYLNVSHNSLSGHVGNLFTDMQHLEQMDLSFNNFSGDLPSSFSSLSNLHELYLQNNQFSGSVSFLANLPLSDLNIENNHFSGSFPMQLNKIPRFRINGNMFHHPGNAHPPPFTPSVNTTFSGNISYNSTATSSSDRIYSNNGMFRNDKRKWTPGATAGIAVTAVLLAGAVASFFLIKLHSAHKHRKDRSNGAKNSLYSLPITMPRVSKERPPDSFVTNLWHPPLHQIKPDRTSRRKSCSEGNGILLTAKLYFASDLLAATNNFGDDSLIGEGSLGRVYRAKLPDDQVVAVKKIDMADLALCEEDEFLELISNSSHLRHPNITCLLGYCVDQGLYALLYEYVGHGTLSDALHFSNDNSQIPLSWKRRMSIAHGVAQALEYLHCTSSPPVAHGNLKAANVLLDDKLIPHLSDCGLTGLRPYTGFKSKITEIPIHGKGYNAPESSIPGSDKTKSDVYSFGVMLLELLTGKNALDSSIDGEEQSLVEWASSRLHSMTLLEEIVDPAIRGTIPKKGLSFFADIVSRCTQSEPELRPQMPEITDLLVQLVQRTSFSDVEGQADLENELSNQSFWTTYSHFDQGPLPPAI